MRARVPYITCANTRAHIARVCVCGSPRRVIAKGAAPVYERVRNVPHPASERS